MAGRMPGESTPLVGRGERGDSGNGVKRDLDMARNAFEANDLELSKKAHQLQVARSPEDGHQKEGSLIKSVVFGGLDGILTTFAIVSGATGGGFGTDVILILGFSSKIADAMAMGLGDALSTKAEHDHIRQEREREHWEFDNYPDGEIAEMIELYQNKGMTFEDANRVIRLMSEHRDFFVDVMMVEELGLQVPDDDDNPWFDGFVTFCSFIVFGIMPLLGYCVFPFAFPDLSSHELFAIACISTALTLFVLGVTKSLFSVTPWWRSGLEMVFIGAGVCIVAYGIGSITKAIVGLDPDELTAGGPAVP